jgi:hypothetical protein
VRLIETSDVEALRQAMLEQEISDKSPDYRLTAGASDVVRRSGKLLQMPQR